MALIGLGWAKPVQSNGLARQILDGSFWERPIAILRRTMSQFVQHVKSNYGVTSQNIQPFLIFNTFI
jgi:hypothetical protein